MLDSKFIDGYIDSVGDLLLTEPVKRMKTFNHHEGVDTHFHSLHVSYRVYSFLNKIDFEKGKALEITRASLLHDLYLYNWYTDKHNELHAFYHPKESVKNIEKYCLLSLNSMQKDMILRHMFPLGRFPNSFGGWLLTISDKHCAALELAKKTGSFDKIYDEINQRTELK